MYQTGSWQRWLYRQGNRIVNKIPPRKNVVQYWSEQLRFSWKKKTTKIYSQEQLQFSRRRNIPNCCTIFARTAPIYQEGFFKFLQEHLQFSRRTYPQEQLFWIIALSDAFTNIKNKKIELLKNWKVWKVKSKNWCK